MDFGPYMWPAPTAPTATQPPTEAPTDPPGGPETDATFLSMLFLTFASLALTGSTLEWVISRGVFVKGLKNPCNTYNIVVLVAGTFSGIQAICNFLLYYYQPKAVWFLFQCLTQWMIMTHASVMVVSNRLSLLYRNPRRVWKRLLYINVFMLPISILVFVSWGGDKLSGYSIYKDMNRIIEPTQIALWGIIEFVLSGIFIVKMWAFKWGAMERKAIFVLVLVGLCDLSTVFANILVGDLPSTVVKAFAYCLRIRLEINVLCVLVDYLKAKSRRVSGFPEQSSTDKFPNCPLTSSLRGPYAEKLDPNRSVRFSDDDDSIQLHMVELCEDGKAKAAQVHGREEALTEIETSSREEAQDIETQEMNPANEVETDQR